MLNCIIELFRFVMYVSYKIFTIKKQIRPRTVSIMNMFILLSLENKIKMFLFDFTIFRVFLVLRTHIMWTANTRSTLYIFCFLISNKGNYIDLLNSYVN